MGLRAIMRRYGGRGPLFAAEHVRVVRHARDRNADSGDTASADLGRPSTPTHVNKNKANNWYICCRGGPRDCSFRSSGGDEYL